MIQKEFAGLNKVAGVLKKHLVPEQLHKMEQKKGHLVIRQPLLQRMVLKCYFSNSASLARRSSPRKFLAIILPSLSSSMLAGMDMIP